MDAGSGVQPIPPVRESTPTPKRKTANGTWNEFVQEADRKRDGYEKQYGVPARRKLVAVGSAYPFTTVLALVFAGLALFPVLTFLGFSAFVLVSFTLTALTFALVFAGIIILGAGVVLLGVTAIAFSFALFLTVSGFIAYTAYRLVFHVQSPEGQGFGAWKAETMMRFGLVDVAGVRAALASSGPRPTANGSSD
ncbi:hypothetical protein FS749_015240 [Ceratobasidium sp. UAMH 11750]|nr:hypothetical protein FS749_015240 [Ceratobasidium sp. UAMH 11750]